VSLPCLVILFALIDVSGPQISSMIRRQQSGVQDAAITLSWTCLAMRSNGCFGGRIETRSTLLLTRAG
jgi:hypothetical protein